VWTTNWMRFAGDNTVDLDASVYGIVGEYDGDARRSNWAGKTAFIEAIRFALYGVHRAAREDGWISHGEAGGSVSVTLTDGTLITRSRRRGQATKLIVERAGEQATGDAAQTVLDRVLGIGREDFDVTCWFGQKQMARLILARPVERFDLVSGWFGLDPLQRCEERVRLHLSGLSTDAGLHDRALQGAQARLTALTDAWAGVLGEAPRGWTLEGVLRGEIASRGARVKAAQARVNEALGEVDAFADARRAVEAAEELAEIRTEGKALSEQIDVLAESPALVTDWTEKHSTAKTALVRAADELKAKRTLARGEFSGRCPVDSSECPAKADINARASTNAGLYDAAAKAYDVAAKEESVTRLELDGLVSEARKHDSLVGRREALRARARVLLPKAESAKGIRFDADEHEKRLGALDAAHRALASEEEGLHAVQAALAELEGLLVSIDTEERALGRLRAREAVGRAALRIFGRQGAQKRIAESALVEIEAGANGILREAGIDLSLRVQWGREGVGLAAWCGECGAPFPSSARVKACERCRAERGPKVVERLDIELSDRSGAAEDLAGAALQLSAAAWLRRERGVSWSVAFLDEPFGALDEANRKGFAAHLVAMLRGSAGFEQAFIVAHHPDVIDGLPARLVVRAGEVASSIEAA